MAEFVGIVLLLLVAAASVPLWIAAVVRLRRGRPLVELQPRRPVPWSGLEVLLVLTLALLLQGGLALAGERLAQRVWPVEQAGELPDEAPLAPDRADENEARRQAVQLLGATLGGLLAVLLLLLILHRSAGATAADLGLSRRQLAADIRLGACAFVALAPPVYLVQLILVQWFPSRHPVIELIDERPELALLLSSWLITVGVAPLLEELLFRVSLQGWLEKLAGRGGSAAGDRSHRVARWPIVASATLFALVHVGHGPDPLPLLLLGLGLGYLYRQTHRLAPIVVVHLLLNAVSMLLVTLGALTT